MKIVVVSDSHSNLTVLNNIVMKNYDADVFYHLGDSELPEYLLNSYTCVRGNCDYNDFPREKDCILEGFKIHLEHGNSLNFAINPEQYIKEKKCDIFLFGHTHKKYVNKIGSTYAFNPGSITRPRDSEIGTYLVLYLAKGQPVKHEFKSLEEKN
mgnify:FL=1